MDIKDRIICPAVIFAASRKDRVIGRTNVLINSMRTKTKASHSGEPWGTKFDIVTTAFFLKEDVIDIIHIGIPKVIVTIRWEDIGIEEGINLIILVIINKVNKVGRRVFENVNVFDFCWIWVKETLIILVKVIFLCDILNKDGIIIIATIKDNHIRLFNNELLNIMGSNDEKISIIIKI